MPGVRKEAGPTGRFQGWHFDARHRRRWFWGTHDRDETLRMARRLEDDALQVRLGYRPAPKPADLHRDRSVKKTVQEYLAWGAAHGGRGGRPWSLEHAHHRKNLLRWWVDRLGLAIMADLDGIMPRAEVALLNLYKRGRAGKTICNYTEALRAFCRWCVEREYLSENPLTGLVPFDTTPKTRRRALTAAELKRLLAVAPPWRRLLYETAAASGLRRGELMALRVKHLDTKRGGLRLEGAWTKNRKDGFQYLPKSLVKRLARAKRGKHPGDRLLRVPYETGKWIKRDLKKARIPQSTEAGEIDFHALRVAYVTFVLEAGASAKEAQVLARHSTLALTMETYARAREDRLADLAEAVGQTVAGGPACVTRVPSHKGGAGGEDTTSCNEGHLRLAEVVPPRGVEPLSPE